MSTPDPVAGLVRLLNIVGPQPISTADALRPQLGNLNTGDYVPAHVLSTLPNGRFHVLVKDQLLDLNLPPNTEPGETLQLRVERNDGRLQFSMQNPMPSPGTPQQGTGVNLSPAARLLQEALQRTQTQEPARLSGTEPLAQGRPEAAPLAENLRQAVRESGLFYESHQQQWVAGNKPLTELMREPQARMGTGPLVEARDVPLDPERVASLLKAVQSATPEQLPQALRQLAEQLRQEGSAERPAAPSGPAPSGAERSVDQPADDSALLQRLAQRTEAGQPLTARQQVLDELLARVEGDSRSLAATGPDLARVAGRQELHHLVQQQIQALETHHLLWQGQVWPGQDLDWEIVGQRDDGQSGAEAAPTHWTSRLALELPHLGRVVAHVQLSQGQVSLKLAAEQEGTATALREQQQRLVRQFEAAELLLTSTTVVRGIDEEGGHGQ